MMLLVPLEFYDAKQGLMKLDYWSNGEEPWLFYRHPDGQWVSLRRATKDDIDKLESTK